MIVTVEISTPDESILVLTQAQVPDHPSWSDLANALRKVADTVEGKP